MKIKNECVCIQVGKKKIELHNLISKIKLCIIVILNLTLIKKLI